MSIISHLRKNSFQYDNKTYYYTDLKSINDWCDDQIENLPYCIRIILESLLRNYDDKEITETHIRELLNHYNNLQSNTDIPFKPSRILLQDLTGIPAIVDLASLREKVVELGEDPTKINPEIPLDLVIDHSIQVDEFGSPNAIEANMKWEFHRNEERYKFIRWAQNAFSRFRVIPPGKGIMHQVNLEYLSNIVQIEKLNENDFTIFPDSVYGTDSHTPMINGVGVLGWGVGGIEAEACLLGKASYFPIPKVVGIRLKGCLQNGALATDLALTITNLLRNENVVGKFVEFFGKGINTLSVADRATISNMAPEYGATVAFFPVDQQAINYLKNTGKDDSLINLIEIYCKENQLWYSSTKKTPKYSYIIDIDLSTIEPTISGPKRPQDTIKLDELKTKFQESLTSSFMNQGYELNKDELATKYPVMIDSQKYILKTGSLAIAAITSCTNTSNPTLMIAAGLLAKKAVENGLEVPKYIKTSMAPGSTTVIQYLKDANLLSSLEQLGFHLVGHGCTTCSGNSGPLIKEVEKVIKNNNLLVCSVLSGNRNFEGRIHPLTRANFLASPPLVVAFALAGTMDINLKNDPIGWNTNHDPIYLKDIWPSLSEINMLLNKVIKPKLFKNEYQNIFNSNDLWNKINTSKNLLFKWDRDSTYIQNPPFLKGNEYMLGNDLNNHLNGLRTLAVFGDTTTTDHISPAGNIPIDSPTGEYLNKKSISVREFNTYGSRRGNHHVMVRGTFANVRLRNQLVPNIEGGYTIYWPTKEVTTIYDASKKYKKLNTGLIILAGKDYGMGSSRDWAAKGTKLLGVKAVIAKSFERIHRSNLVMMGVLPLTFEKEQNIKQLGLTGEEIFQIEITNNLSVNQTLAVKAIKDSNQVIEFKVIANVFNDIELSYIHNGGILPTIVKEKLTTEGS